MSQWTSEYAILRDLSLAQGSVPGAIEGTRAVGAGDKPPSLNITEETEEEFFKHGSADADMSAAPDLGLIKQMLDMVRDVTVSSDEEVFPNQTIVIHKLNPECTQFVPNNVNTSTPTCQSPKKDLKKAKPKKRQRNIAVESILQVIADNKKKENTDVTPEPMKLLKPNDFISNNVDPTTEKTECVQSKDDQTVKTVQFKNEATAIEIAKEDEEVSPTVAEKVNGWLNTQTESPFPKKTPKVTLEATQLTSMFRKRTVTEKVKKDTDTVKRPITCGGGDYKPSTLANEYYQKYVERSKFKESVKDDIWSRAEKRMKELDDKRKLELAKVSSPSARSQGSEPGDQIAEDAQATQSSKDIVTVVGMPFTIAALKRCLNVLSLPQHRHQLTGECIVCKVFTKTDSKN